MSAEPPHKLLAKWQQGDLPVERAIGQLLQHVAFAHFAAINHQNNLSKSLHAFHNFHKGVIFFIILMHGKDKAGTEFFGKLTPGLKLCPPNPHLRVTPKCIGLPE